MANSKLSMAIHYIKDICGKTVRISFAYSPTFALYGLLWWIGFFIRTRYSWRITSYALEGKTKWLDRYFEKNYSSIICKHLTRVSYYEEILSKAHSNKIWVFWGQGEDSMPDLVKSCYRQLKKYNENVFLVTNHNLNELIDIDAVIIDKVKRGRIGYANFSDIIRNSLLAKYGGLWLDATVWVSGKIPSEQLSRMPIYSANCEELIGGSSVRFWSSYEWNWSSWCLWARTPENPFYVFVSNMLQAIAVREDIWPDYVIQDYLFYYAFRKSALLKEWIESINIHNPQKDQFAFMMPEKFDSDRYEKLTTDEVFFKLRYRKNWPTVTESGEETFYGRILRNTI